MFNRVPVVLVGALVALTFAASSAGAPQASPAAALDVVAAAALPAHGGGGPQPAPLGALPLHAQDYARAKAEANARAGVHSSSATAQAAGPAVSSYPNVSPSFNGDYDTGGTPPDTTGAIGPDRYIETVNTQYAVYSRTGAVLDSGSLSALTGIATGLFGYALSDPQVTWDAKTQRFYYAAVYYDSLFLSDNGLAIGWSKTATPSSASDWCQFAIKFGAELPDYPKLGDSSDFLIYGFNQFGNSGNTYEGSQVVTVNKPAAGATCPATTSFAAYGSGFLKNADGTPAATPVPANLVDDATGTGYVVANADLTTPSPHSANFASVYSVTPNGVNANGIPIAKVSGPTNVTVPSYSLPSSAAQQGSSYLIDTLDGRFEAAVAAVDPSHGGTLALWTAHAVFGGAGSEERWYEVDPSSGSVLQSGAVTDPNRFVWNGSVSPDRASNGTTGSFGDSWAMSVSTSSSTTYPAIQFLWQKSGSTASGLSPLVQSGGADVDISCSATAPCRWGDYSGASPDPAATGSVGKVWLGNQYVLAGGNTSTVSWRTWLFGVTPTGGGGGGGALSFATATQTLTAGSASSAITVHVMPTQATDTTVTVSASSGGVSTSSTGPWAASIPLTIPATQSSTPAFYFRDTKAGSPTITASATGLTSATQAETVNAGPAATIAVSPSSVAVPAGASQSFSATAADQWGNATSTASATWSTNVPGGSVSPTTGSSTTFQAGTSAGSGSVTAGLNGVSNSATVTVTSSPPAAPTGLVATANGHRRISLSWGSSGSAVTYTVYRGTSSGTETSYRTGVAGTSFSDTSVATGVTYYYEVTAVGPGGESAPSNEAHAKAK